MSDDNPLDLPVPSMARPRTPDSHVVRRFASDKTHVMKVTRVTVGFFVKPYWRPEPDRAACGVMIADGVVMQPGTTTRCRTCVHLTGITEEG